jgi:hypothetical protein
MATQQGKSTNRKMAKLWEKAKAQGLSSIEGLTLDEAELREVSDTSSENALEVEGTPTITGGDEWIPPDPTAVINKDRPDENHPTRGYQIPGKRLRWCTEMHRNKTGLQHWQPISHKEHPELVPIEHPLTSKNDGAQDQIRMNDSFLCEAPIGEVEKRKRYYQQVNDKRVDRKLYESHKAAQREAGSSGITFKTGPVRHGTVGSQTVAKRSVSVSVPAQIK